MHILPRRPIPDMRRHRIAGVTDKSDPALGQDTQTIAPTSHFEQKFSVLGKPYS